MIADMIQTAEITAALGNGDVRVCPPVRVTGWVRNGETMSATVSWGPFLDRVSFSTVLVAANGGKPKAIDAAADGLPVSLPGGSEYTYLLTLDGE